MKTFEINNEKITIDKTYSYGQYVLSGLDTSIHCTDSEIWDYCDDEDNASKMLEVRERAYQLLINNKY